MLHTVLFCLIILVTFVFQAVTGFGGPLIAMPLAIPLVGVATAKPILTLCSWVTSILVLLRSHRDVNLRETVKMASVIILFLFGQLALRAAPTLFSIDPVWDLCDQRGVKEAFPPCQAYSAALADAVFSLRCWRHAGVVPFWRQFSRDICSKYASRKAGVPRYHGSTLVYRE